MLIRAALIFRGLHMCFRTFSRINKRTKLERNNEKKDNFRRNQFDLISALYFEEKEYFLTMTNLSAFSVSKFIFSFVKLMNLRLHESTLMLKPLNDDE